VLGTLAELPAGERVVVVGGGLAGLGTALALKNSGKSVVILERDDAPPPMDPGSAFTDWSRPGVPQFHHTHIFLSRLRTILRDRHPEVLDDLARAGIERSSIDQVLPLSLCDRYVPKADDDEGVLYLKHLLRGVSLGLFDDATAMEKFTAWSLEHEQQIKRRQEDAYRNKRARRPMPGRRPEPRAEAPVESKAEPKAEANDDAVAGTEG
jgi:hypothetical protein